MDNKKKFSVNISGDLLKQFESACLESKWSIQTMVEECIRMALPKIRFGKWKSDLPKIWRPKK